MGRFGEVDLSSRRLEGRVALVTGASTGIGLAIARLFAAEGAFVHAAARRRAEGAFHAHSLDVTDQPAVARLIEEIGELDQLVYAAGTNIPSRRSHEMTPERWKEVIDVNLTGAFNCLQAALPQLRERRGDAILIASVSGAWPDLSGPIYQASKAGMIGLARGLAFEEHQHGVRISSILPGLVDTPILDRRPVPPPEEVRQLALRPEHVAEACLFLAALPREAFVPELTMVPTYLQSIGKGV